MRRFTLLIALLGLLFTGCEFTTAPKAQGKINYVCVGQNYKDVNYKDEKGTEWTYKLNGCIEDATSMAALFKHYAGSTLGTGVLLTDKYTSYRASMLSSMKTALSDLASTATENDLTFFYYSGHGYEGSDSVAAGSMFFITTYLGSTSWRATAYAPVDLLNLMDAIPGKKLIIMDSCYAGAAEELYGGTANTDTGASVWETAFKGTDYPTTNLHVLASSTSKEATAAASAGNHSPFTALFLSGSGWISDTSYSDTVPAAKNGYVTVDSMYSYITPRYSQAASVNGSPDNLVIFSL